MSISLPLATESVRCADFAFSNNVDPGGTALAPDVVVLVEVAEPWPKPVAKHEAITELVKVAQTHPEQVRLLAAIPHDEDAPRIIAFRRTPTGMSRAEAPYGQQPADGLRSVLADADGIDVVTGSGRRTMLVCTQGSHDVCCGTEGAVFASWLEQERQDVEVFRVSHTGGHRFAPTAMSLPDGRMWAYLDPDSASSVIDRTGDTRSLASRCRGWWGARTGPAQIAERAVFADLGFDADLIDRSVELGHDSAVVVRVGADIFDLTVEPGRAVPAIACGAFGGEPVKPGQEWLVTSGPTKR
ncbi:MAG: hypothetical protein ACI81L_002734 [Verrucomicrobiales bacterium]|jgi:hypothetical protein